MAELDPMVNSIVIGSIGAVLGTLTMGGTSMVRLKARRKTKDTSPNIIDTALDYAEEGRSTASMIFRQRQGRSFIIVIVCYIGIIGATIYFSPLRMSWLWMVVGYFSVPFVFGFLSAFFPKKLTQQIDRFYRLSR